MAEGKVYTSAPILVNSDGLPIPAYLDRNDKTDSPEGTYKPITDEHYKPVYDTRLTGGNMELMKGVKTEIEEVIKSETVEPGSRVKSHLEPKGQSEVWFFVSIDQCPWKLQSGTPWYTSSDWGEPGAFFPILSNVEQTYSVTRPAITMFLGFDPSYAGLQEPSNFNEAKNMMLPVSNEIEFEIKNDSTKKATVNITLLRIWR